MAINISNKPLFVLSIILASPIIILTLIYVPLAYILHLVTNLVLSILRPLKGDEI